VPAGVFADHIDDRRSRASGVVQISDAIGKARTKVKQRERGTACHSAVSVSRTGAHPFSKTENRSYFWYLFECDYQRQFSGAGIRKADADAGGSSRF
jgi:hypothetical protein